jgi:ABC-type glycerol-3-phosphate transport system permease component
LYQGRYKNSIRQRLVPRCEPPTFVSYDSLNWGGLTAASSLITLPVLLMAFLVQKHIVRGLTIGALKG